MSTSCLEPGDLSADPPPLDEISTRWSQIKEQVVWPAQKALLDAGFTDTYRAAHPDPAARAGITWTYGYPYPHLEANEQLDRIDFVMAFVQHTRGFQPPEDVAPSIESWHPHVFADRERDRVAASTDLIGQLDARRRTADDEHAATRELRW